MISANISDKVLVIGTSIDGKGGIAVLLKSYSCLLKPFHYICSHKSVGRINQVWLAFSALFKNVYYCIFCDIQIVHIHTASYRSFFRESVYVLVCKIFRKKVILHLHGGEFEIFYQRYPKYCNYICHKADRIIAVSGYFGKVFKKLNLNKHVEVLYNVVEQPLGCKNRIVHQKLHILFLGTIDENKGIFDIVECFVKNKEYLRDKVVLDIAGVGDDVKLVRVIHEGEVNEFVNYHGWLDVLHKNEILSQADLYVQPSYFESLGIAILEAMSYELPIIASNTGGIPELVTDGENGFLITPGDMDCFYDKLIYFINHKEALGKMGEKSYTKAVRFYPENIEKKIVEIYKSLL